jgi:hypothetical protein
MRSNNPRIPHLCRWRECSIEYYIYFGDASAFMTAGMARVTHWTAKIEGWLPYILESIRQPFLPRDGYDCVYAARAAFTRPYTQNRPVPGIGSAVSKMRLRVCAFVLPCATRSAARPATWGAAIEVPSK